ncbi:MAG TPA: imidazole glycerol phosphate synthase subunit HisH [Gemmatimonadaceae bacterium]|jgi:glutamine amidotransferase|nr:imidazole glycerol phosphate synthase subunit HisH [Gemmatimonadaceae bacterium]
MRVTIFDYGAGNLHSLLKAVAQPGVDVRVEDDAARATRSDVLLLPGVGAFAQAAARLAPGRAAIRRAVERGLPIVGICLGMQLLFEESAEGAGIGLGLLPGRVERLRARRVPHIGWNSLESDNRSRARRALPHTVYFAHSYACRPHDPDCVDAWCTHETDRFAAMVCRGRVAGVQFHPEKSSRSGVRFLQTLLRELRS